MIIHYPLYRGSEPRIELKRGIRTFPEWEATNGVSQYGLYMDNLWTICDHVNTLLYCIYIYKLVGGLEHFIFFHILGMIIPTDSCFSEGLKPPTRIVLNMAISKVRAFSHEKW